MNIKKTVEENAQDYFEKAKKARKKVKGAKKALIKSLEKLKKEEQKEYDLSGPSVKKIRKKDWFEKFRWFISSDGFLVIGGRDAMTNEILIKKHTEDKDLVFHTDMAGSPFAVIKSEGKKIPKKTIEESGVFVATFSRAWKRGLTTTEVYFVKPAQVTKEAKAGEFISRGSFMIYGDREYLNPVLDVSVGIFKDRVIAGPSNAIKKHCKKHVKVILGDKKPSDVAKIIKKQIGGDLDEIIRALPAGTCDVKFDS